MAAMGQSMQENMDRCKSVDPDTRIAGCTAIIQAGLLTVLVTNERLSIIYDRRGTAYSSKHDHDRAIQDFNDAIRLNPNQAYNYRNRGIDYYEKSDYDRAIQDFSEAIRLNPKDTVRSIPNDSSVYALRGNAYRKKGDYDRAIQDLNEAIRLHPNYEPAYHDRGIVFDIKDDYDSAIQNYDQAIRLNPNDSSAYFSRGRAYFNKGDYDRAIQDYSKAIRLNQNFTTAYENRGNSYFVESNLTAAIADYEHTISAAPSSDAAVFAALSLHVIMKHQGHDDAQQLARVAAASDLSKWPGLLLKLDLGQLTADEVMTAAASASSDKRVQKFQICEANYFTGEDALLHHQRAIALTRLKAARDGCPKGANDYALALAELKRLGATAVPAK